jgi:acyl carrier protein
MRKKKGWRMENSVAAQALIEYLRKQVLHNSQIVINEDSALVSSGLIDSFALIEVLLELEKITGRRIPAGRVSPADMDTVRKMLAIAESVGTAR